MSRLTEEGVPKAETGWKLHLLHQTISQVVNTKKKALMEVKNATPVNTQMIRKQNSLIAGVEKGLVVWIEDQTSHNIPLSQNLVQSKALSLFNSVKAERWGSCRRKVWSISGLVRVGERSHLHNIGVHDAVARADKEAMASDPEDLAKKINEGGCTKQTFNVKETVLFRRGGHLGLSQWERSQCLASKLWRTGWLSCWQLMHLVTLSGSQCSFTLLDISAPFRTINWLCPRSINKTTKPGWQHICLQHGSLNSLSPLLRPSAQKKKISFKILLLMDNAAGGPWALMEMLFSCLLTQHAFFSS